MTNGKAINESTARLRRRRSVAKMQRNWIIALAVLTVLLIAAFIVVDYIVNIIYFEDYDGAKYQIKQKNGIYVMCDSNGDTLDLSVSADTSKNTYIYVTELGTEVKVDPDTGINTVYSVIDTVDGEEVGVSDRIQMFKQIKQADIDKLEIHNEHGSFTFYVDKDGDFQIKGHEGTPYSQVMFSSLAVSCGYSLSTRKIQDPIKDENGLYTEYGLAPEVRIDENGNEYNYEPYWYRITDLNGNSHTVYIGDAVPSNTGFTVIIDAGHGGFDSGKVGNDGTLEKDLNLEIAKKLERLLTAADVRVLMTRTEDVALSPEGKGAKQQDLQKRVEFMNQSNADCVVSIHQNSFPEETIKGAQVFYYTPSEEGRNLSSILQKQLVRCADPKNHRLEKANNTYYLLKNSTPPTVIVECGFLSNPEETKKLVDDTYQQTLAWAIHLGILQYLNEKMPN